jgi:hypothetical protein
MEFKVQKKEQPKADSKYSKDEIGIAYHFSKEIWKEFDRFCKAIVLFGSSNKQALEPGSDIDILVIVDDVSYYMTPEVVETYRIICEKNIAKISTRIHLTTLKFTTFWDYIRIGDPIGINILRDGVALIDTGFFTPLQMLLFQGRIRPTKESVVAYYSRVPQTYANSKSHIMQGALDLYWAAIDSSHAALMKLGEMPETPAKISELIEEKLVKPKHVDKKCPGIMKELYVISKKILHRDIKEITGKEYDELEKKTRYFLDEMKRFITKG